MTERLSGELLRRLRGLSASEQRRVLEFARALSQATLVGVPGKQLLDFVGIISRDDLERMNAAIAAGCEQVDSHEW